MAAPISAGSTTGSFSFGQYCDPAQMGFGALRVINDDLDSALAHRDSLGSGSVIRPGDVQLMSAGTGIRHSEFNASETDSVHFLQIWIIPEKQGLEPAYAEKHFPEAERRNRLKLIVSPDGRDGSLKIHQDAAIHAGVLEKGVLLTEMLKPDRRYWLQVAKGSLDVNGHTLVAGEGLAIAKEDSPALETKTPSEILLFELK